MGDRDRGTVVGDQKSAIGDLRDAARRKLRMMLDLVPPGAEMAAFHECPGCGAEFYGMAGYCEACAKAGRCLDRLYVEWERKSGEAVRRELRRAARAESQAEAFRRTAGFVRKWIWLPAAIAGVAAAVFIGMTFALAFVEWMRE